MKRVLSQADTVQKLVGHQKVKAGTVYRESRFVLHVPCEDGKLLYSTLTGALFLLEPGETTEDCLDQLIEERFFVPEGFDEQAYCDAMRRLGRMAAPWKKNKTNFTILTTTDCNARCFYCYEMGIPRYSMSPETAKDVADYIARVSGGEKVKLNWFGGEPLYNREAIDSICRGLRERGIPYTSTMTSNGFFLDEEMAITAKTDWNMTNAQITLDGTERIYNQTKAYIGYSGNAYQRVLDNIGSALGAGIEVSIRLNMDGRNADDLFSLSDELALRFGGRKGIHTYVRLLQEITGKIHVFPSQRIAAERCLELTQKLVKQKLTKPSELKRDVIVNHCMADNDACEVIAPDGRVCKCEHYKESEFIGSIYSDGRNQALIDTWKEIASFPECGDCVLYPRCYLLKKCEWTTNECPESWRIMCLERMKMRILSAYKTVRQKQSAEDGK